MAGYRPSTGNFGNILGGLRTAGLIDYPEPGRIALTDAGHAAVPFVDIPDVRAAVIALLKAPQQRVLAPVLDAYPDQVARSDLAVAAGYRPSTGNFGNLLGSLRSVGLIDYPSAGQVRAAPWLFEGGQ